jgi:hypothetical protein
MLDCVFKLDCFYHVLAKLFIKTAGVDPNFLPRSGKGFRGKITVRGVISPRGPQGVYTALPS